MRKPLKFERILITFLELYTLLDIIDGTWYITIHGHEKKRYLNRFLFFSYFSCMGHKSATVSEVVVNSIPTWRNEIFHILFLRSGNEAKRSVDSVK